MLGESINQHIMKLNLGAWIGIIVGGAGMALGIYSAVDPQAFGRLVTKIGPENISAWMPVGIFGFLAVVFGAAFSPMIASSLRNSRMKKRLATVGIRGKAQIISVLDTYMTVNNNPYIKLVVELKPGVRATFTTLVPRVQIPRVGDVIEVIYDPAEPTCCMPVKG